jgi:hypothetical protein
MSGYVVEQAAEGGAIHTRRGVADIGAFVGMARVRPVAYVL